MARAVRAGSTVGSPLVTLASLAAVSISSHSDRSLLEAAPSVPRPTATPAASSAGTGATPEAPFMLDWGQCTTPTLRSASSAISAGVGQIMCAATHPVVEDAEPRRVLDRPLAVLLRGSTPPPSGPRPGA